MYWSIVGYGWILNETKKATTWMRLLGRETDHLGSLRVSLLIWRFETKTILQNYIKVSFFLFN